MFQTASIWLHHQGDRSIWRLGCFSINYLIKQLWMHCNLWSLLDWFWSSPLMQYLKHIQARDLPVFERFPVLICITLVWAYAHLLTASGAYKHVPERTKINCRTDRAHLISSAPWYVVLWPCKWKSNAWQVLIAKRIVDSLIAMIWIICWI